MRIHYYNNGSVLCKRERGIKSPTKKYFKKFFKSACKTLYNFSVLKYNETTLML